MKKLDILIIRSYIKPLLMTFFISIFILLMQFLWKYMEDMVGKGLDWSVIAELLVYSTAGLVPLALPLSILMSSLMTFGNLGQNYELLALKAAGISLKRAMLPLVFVTGLISMGAFFFANRVMPYTQLKSLSLLYDVTHKRPEINIKTGIFNNDMDGYTLKVNSKNRETGILHGLMLYDHKRNRGNKGVTVADSAQMVVTTDGKNMLLVLYSGNSYQETNSRNNKKSFYPLQRDTFQEKHVVIPMANELIRTDEDLFSKNYQMLNVSQLDVALDSLNLMSAKKTKEFTRSLLTRSYFTTKRKDSIYIERFLRHEDYYKKLPLDSLHALLNLDSILLAKSNREKEMIYDNAIEKASALQTEINYKQEYAMGHTKYVRRHEIEWHKKYVLAFASFIFFFIGAPLGAIIRKGGMGMPVVISTLFFVAYYIVSLTGEKMVRESVLLAYQGMWLATSILLPLGIYFTYKATYDSALMDSETYTKIFERILKVFKLKKKKV